MRFTAHHALACPPHVCAVCQTLADQGIEVTTYDAHGHGKSEPTEEGGRAFVGNYKHLVGLAVPHSTISVCQNGGRSSSLEDLRAWADLGRRPTCTTRVPELNAVLAGPAALLSSAGLHDVLAC